MRFGRHTDKVPNAASPCGRHASLYDSWCELMYTALGINHRDWVEDKDSKVTTSIKAET